MAFGVFFMFFFNVFDGFCAFLYGFWSYFDGFWCCFSGILMVFGGILMQFWVILELFFLQRILMYALTGAGAQPAPNALRRFRPAPNKAATNM